MKLGIFCDSFYPEDKAVAVRLFHLAEGFSSVPGVSVTVHATTADPSHRKLRYRIRKYFVPAPSNESSNAVRLTGECVLGIEMFFRILFSRYDVILISSPPFFASVLAAGAAMLRRIPYVFDVRDEYPEVFFTAGLVSNKSLVGKLLVRVERLIYRNAHQVITVTEGICARIDAKSGKTGTAKLVRNGFDEMLFRPMDKKNKQFTVVFHGNIGKFQQPQLILSVAEKVYARNSDIRFVVIGYGNNDHDLKKNNCDNVSFLGKVPYAQIPPLIGAAHVGISFRSDDLISYNSFPVKLYEYVGVSLPVIITPVSEAGHFFEANKIGFQYTNEDAGRIADKIIELSENSGYYREVAERISAVRQMFSRQNISHLFASQLIDSLNKNGLN